MLFKNGLVFMENGTFEKVDVRTKDDKIIEVGPSLPANGEEVKDISATTANLSRSRPTVPG